MPAVLAILGFLGLVLLLVLACEPRPPASAEEPTQGAALDDKAAAPEAPSAAAAPSNDVESDTILLGEVGSLTGGEATFGISTRNGIDLAIQEANAQGGVKGKKLAVRVYDDQGKPEEAANAVRRLISQDDVVLILGEVASSASLAMAPIAQEAGVPMISPSSTNPKVTEVGDYIFRVCFIDPFQGLVMAKFTREHLKLTNVAMLVDNKSDYSLGLSDVFARELTALGGTIVGTEAYSKGDTDFRAQLTALKQKQPDAIYVPGYYTEVGLVARQARELGLKVPLLGGDGWDSEKLFELGGSAIEGSYFSNHHSFEEPSEQAQKFVAAYEKAYEAKPDALAALGYDAAMVAIEAMRRAPDLSGPALRDAIAATKDHPGVAGTVSIDERRDARKPAVVLQIKEGKASFLTSIAP